MIIGKTEQFGFEVLSDDLTGELAEIYIYVAGQRVSGRNPVFLPTFVGELSGFLKSQESETPSEFDFSCLSHEEAFDLFHQISNTDNGIGCLSPTSVWNYHRLHNIDDAVDDWEIYVYDVSDQKHIVCREKHSESPDGQPGHIWGASLPRNEFIRILEEFVKLFPT